MLELPFLVAMMGGGGWALLRWQQEPPAAAREPGVELALYTGPDAVRRHLMVCETLLRHLAEIGGAPRQQLRCLQMALRALSCDGGEGADELVARLETCLRRLGPDERARLQQCMPRMQEVACSGEDMYGLDMWCCVTVQSMLQYIDDGSSTQ